MTMNLDNNAIVKQLMDCAATNVRCVAECLSINDARLMMECVQYCSDCAELCMKTARLLKAGSRMGVQYLTMCEEASRLCYEECKKYSNLRVCVDCMQENKRCADACRARTELMLQD